ncbi:MAG: hypothetical protein JNM78_15065 [Cyclobacteriaceae bacterium]|nr:hypothetical protein [Cyclobacteriaceae bacterium]
MKAEEDLQNKIEQGLTSDASIDGEAYQYVFKSLKKEPTFHVSTSFADRVVSMLDRKEERRDYWWMAAGIFLSVIALIVTFALVKAELTAGVFTFLSGYQGLVIFGIAFILLLHWVDKKVIKRQLSTPAH